MSSRLTWIVAAVAGVAGLIAAALWFAPGPAALQSGVVLPQPRALGEFALVADDGQPFTLQRLRGHWTLIFPGFTHCPDVCPTTLALLKQVRVRLAGKPDVQVVFLSVDPQRDTPQALSTYVHYFDPAFTGVTAAEPELSRVATQLAIAYEKVPGPSPDSYSMDHSAALVLVNPQAQVAAYLSPPFQLETLAADLRKATGAS
ncbi:MAG TPA: SCO family protein [Nevskiaceae bacterium]|nr:SCO family protein [Nevskiaceae bacterium]